MTWYDRVWYRRITLNLISYNQAVLALSETLPFHIVYISLAPRSLSLFKNVHFPSLVTLVTFWFPDNHLMCPHCFWLSTCHTTNHLFLETDICPKSVSSPYHAPVPVHHASAYLASLTEYSFPACVLWSPSPPIPFLSGPPPIVGKHYPLPKWTAAR